jgi:hypothetical protein
LDSKVPTGLGTFAGLLARTIFIVLAVASRFAPLRWHLKKRTPDSRGFDG